MKFWCPALRQQDSIEFKPLEIKVLSKIRLGPLIFFCPHHHVHGVRLSSREVSRMLGSLGAIVPYVASSCGLAALGTAVWVYWDRKTKLDKISELSKQLEKLAPTDPEYKDAINLLRSMQNEIQGKSPIGGSEASANSPAGSDSGGGDGGD
jgi:hypothetical protein